MKKEKGRENTGQVDYSFFLNASTPTVILEALALKPLTLVTTCIYQVCPTERTVSAIHSIY